MRRKLTITRLASKRQAPVIGQENEGLEGVIQELFTHCNQVDIHAPNLAILEYLGNLEECLFPDILVAEIREEDPITCEDLIGVISTLALAKTVPLLLLTGESIDDDLLHITATGTRRIAAKHLE